jgi:YYY domain-containing protein
MPANRVARADAVWFQRPRRQFPRWRPVKRPARRPLRRRARSDSGGVDIGPFRFTYTIAQLFILLVATTFRFIGLNWDDNLYLHPDERFLAQVAQDIHWPGSLQQYFDSATSPLNPFNGKYTNYVYGTFPLFLTKFVGNLFGQTVYGNVHIPGRTLSALADLGTLLMAAWAARLLFGKVTSLLTATLLAICVLNIQGAHFFTTDSMSTFFAIAAFALAIRAGKSGAPGWFALAGLAVGLAGASKPNLLLTAGFLVLPALEAIRTGGWDMILPRAFRPYPLQNRDRGKPPLILTTALAFVVAVLAFRVGQPYAFLGPNIWDFRLDPRWTTTLSYWRDVQSGIIDMPPSIQWAGRTPYVFILNNLMRWGMGPTLGLTCLAGLAWLLISMLRARRWPSWWLLGIVGWICIHIALYGGGFIQVQRYLLPAYPFLIMLGAWLLVRLINVARRSTWRFRWAHPGYVLPVIVLASTLFYAAAFTNSIYLHPHTRIEASNWIYDNIPAGSTVTSEHWDDGLPLRLPGRDQDMFDTVQLELYNADTEDKIGTIVNQLDRADYIITSSNRIYGSTTRMPDRYPMTTAYYKALFDGSLGFELIKTFEHPPELFGITLDDEWAEESLTVYDHPKVMIFRKTDAWSPNATWLALDDALGDGAIGLKPIDITTEQIMLSPEEAEEYATAGTWSEIFDRGSFTNTWPALWWYLLMQAFALPAIPLLWRVFPRLPDHGYALAKLVGILGVSYVVWLMASLHLTRFGAGTIAVTWLVLTAAGIATIAPKRHHFLDSLIRRWRWIVMSEMVFLGGYIFAVWLRWLNPDLWHPSRGGEKPMDFAFFNAIIRSPYFPPYDPWFAGGAMHYYYWGFVPWATLSKLSGIIPEVAYNLAIPSLFALLLLLVWNVSAIAIARFRASIQDPARGWGSLLIALIAPLLVGVLGNLDMARRIGRGEWEYPLMPSWLEPLGPFGEMLHGIWSALTESRSLPTNAYWESTRVVDGTINEFPYFSFLFADLHAHVMAMPIVAGALVVAASIIDLRPRGPIRKRPLPFDTIGGWKAALPIAVLAGFLTGLLVAANTWDFPPAIALIAVAALIASGASTGWQFPWQTLKDTVCFAAVVFVTGQVLLFPYLSRYGSLPGQLEPSEETTGVADFLTVNGLLLYAVGGLLIAELVILLGAMRRFRFTGLVTIALVVLLGAGGIAIAVVADSAAFLLVVLVGVLGLCVLNRYLSPIHLFVFALTGLAFGLLLFPERFRLANDVGRMNTVFKFYLHAWILLGVAGTIAIAMVFASTPASGWLGNREDERKPERALWLGTRGWLAGLGVLVLAASMYPALATGPRVEDRFNDLPGSLHGLDFMRDAEQVEGPEEGEPVRFSLAGDDAAITWLQDNVAGTPVILEGHLPQYRWGGRISIQTGLPTVLGWAWHETQQRPGYGPWIQQREDDIAYMYGTDQPFSAIQPLLDRYHVRLIVVGDLERAIYPAQGLEKFQIAAASGALTVIYQTESTTIYAYPP